MTSFFTVLPAIAGLAFLAAGWRIRRADIALALVSTSSEAVACTVASRAGARGPAQARAVTDAIRSFLLLPLVAIAVLLAACATPAPGAETTLPLRRAWVDGRPVEYVTTDISDEAMALQEGVNHVPRLAQAIPAPGRPSLVERVYKFPQGEQISVFQSAPLPTGGANADRSYSPLWRLVMVRWLKPAAARELRSEEEILAAQERGELSLELTGIVANCPITRSVDGLPLKGAR
jgi:hypothetical protein